VFPKSCGAPSVNGSQPLCQPVKIYNIGLTPGVRPPVGSLGNDAFNGVTSPGAAAAIQLSGTRAADLGFWPNIDVLASLSPTSQSVMVNVDLGNDNTWLIDKLTGKVFGALGVCGILPCPGHNAGHFAYGHSIAIDLHGNIYLTETITGRRVQKFVLVDGGQQ
jgi:hypothetical protein